MILIEKLRVSADNKYLELVVSTSAMRRISSIKIKLETSEDFEDWDTITDCIDVSSNIQGKSNYEVLYIPFDTTLLANSIYVIQIADKTAIEGPNPEYLVTAVAPLSQFYYCLNKKILKIKDKCDTCLYDVEVFYFLMLGLETAIKLQQYEQAVEFWNELELLCDFNCESCCDTTNTLGGIGIWVINNNFSVS